MKEIEKAFLTDGRSVYSLYQRPGVGFYIPLYQRDYSWDKDNMDQLLDDLKKGVESLMEDDDELRFLGTLITVTETDKAKIQPQDTQALPPTIESVIDGQQRLSTIAIIACHLYETIEGQKKKLTSNEFKDDLVEACDNWLSKLQDVFALDLKRGTPKLKPKIIRGQKDKWVKDDDINESYQSDIANYLAQFINYISVDGAEKPKLPSSGRLRTNIRAIKSWIREIEYAHHEDDTEFPSGKEILDEIKQEYVWDYERPELIGFLQENPIEDKRSFQHRLSALIQLFSVAYYLLERSCFTVIQPINDNWAFDMFQSLNATGTPLTAIETFKPLVVNTFEQGDNDFKGSTQEESFSKIESLFDGLSSAGKKSKRTNDFLTSLALCTDGEKLSSHFSKQRKWIEGVYESFNSKENLITYFGDYAESYNTLWLQEFDLDNQPLNTLVSNSEAELASILILFLRVSNHKMALTVLGQFYVKLLKEPENQEIVDEFVDMVKFILGFYILWRSSYPNSGLDDKYRVFFKGDADKEIIANRWLTLAEESRELSKVSVMEYFRSILVQKNINSKEDWKRRTKNYLSYNSAKHVCWLFLYIASDDTIPDPNNPGLMKRGVRGSDCFLTLEKWNSESFNSLEHIAPQSNANEWDEKIDESLVHSIGNLIMLPLNLNQSLGNKLWDEKLIYYEHLCEKDPDKLREMSSAARDGGYILNEDILKQLEESEYYSQILPIVARKSSNWDAELIESRTDRILDICWERINEWVGLEN